MRLLASVGTGCEELHAIAAGCLFDDQRLSNRSMVRGLPKQCEATLEHLVDELCSAYADLLKDDGEFAWFETCFGLRDFIHMIKLLKQMTVTSSFPEVNLEMICSVLERNFNGVNAENFRAVVRKFLRTSFGEDVADLVLESGHLRDPIDVVSRSFGRKCPFARHSGGERASIQAYFGCE